MVDVDEFLNHFLEHDGVYDPEKAHDYYLKTRELKGRRSTSELGRSKSKREGWAYSKHVLDDQRKAELKGTGESNKQSVHQLQDKAKAKRAEISAKIKAAMQHLTADTKAARDQITAQTKAKIAALPAIPKGLPKAQREHLVAQRKEQLAQIRGESKAQHLLLSDSAKKERTGQREDVAGQRKQLASDLKGSLNKAKMAYQAARDGIKGKYETKLDQQFQSIRDNA